MCKYFLFYPVYLLKCSKVFFSNLGTTRKDHMHASVTWYIPPFDREGGAWGVGRCNVACKDQIKHDLPHLNGIQRAFRRFIAATVLIWIHCASPLIPNVDIVLFTINSSQQWFIFDELQPDEWSSIGNHYFTWTPCFYLQRSKWTAMVSVESPRSQTIRNGRWRSSTSTAQSQSQTQVS